MMRHNMGEVGAVEKDDFCVHESTTTHRRPPPCERHLLCQLPTVVSPDFIITATSP
jgi:hypothetical protein